MVLSSTSVSAEKISEKYEKQCNNGDYDACLLLAMKYEQGQEIKKDPYAAMEIYKKVCSKGIAKGCLNLGYMYKNGGGIAKIIIGQQMPLKKHAKVVLLMDAMNLELYTKMKYQKAKII